MRLAELDRLGLKIKSASRQVREKMLKADENGVVRSDWVLKKDDLVDEVEEGEEEDPDEVDQVPVKAGDFDHGVVGWAVVTLDGAIEDAGNQDHADDDVGGVDGRAAVVNAPPEGELGVTSKGVVKEHAGALAGGPLRDVLVCEFDVEEEPAANQGDEKVELGQSLLVFLGAVDAHRHGVAGDEQDNGVAATKAPVEKVRAFAPGFWIKGAEDEVGAEDAAEEKHFGGEEEPETKLACIELFGCGAEVRCRHVFGPERLWT